MKKILYDASIEHGILDVVNRLPGVCALRFGKTLSKIVLRNNILKVFAVAYLAKDYDIVAPDWYGYGRLLSLLMAILHQKKIVFVRSSTTTRPIKTHSWHSFITCTSS